MKNKKIVTYRDLDVFQRSYKAMLLVMKEIVPKLPTSEKFDLTDQISRSSKAIPRLIAEGFAKRHQKRGFQKYLSDAMAESNETQVGITQCEDIYGDLMPVDICDDLVEEYNIISKQLYKLEMAWDKFSKPNPKH